VYNPYFYELTKLQLREAEQKAEQQHLVSVAIRLRRRVRKASAVPDPVIAQSEPAERPRAVSIGR
jgi:hypothetical protein